MLALSAVLVQRLARSAQLLKGKLVTRSTRMSALSVALVLLVVRWRLSQLPDSMESPSHRLIYGRGAVFNREI